MKSKMAKDKDKTEEKDGQEPIKPENEEKSKSSGGLKLPFVLGIIAGVLLVLILAVRFLFLPYIVGSLTSEATAGENKIEHQSKEDHSDSPLKEELEVFKANEKLSEFVQTGRITTNPRQSTQFVVADFGIIFFPKDEESLKELYPGGKKEEGNSSLPPSLSSRVRGIINSVLGSMSVEELQVKRDSIPEFVMANLKPFFKEKKLFIKEVILQEFIIQ